MRNQNVHKPNQAEEDHNSPRDKETAWYLSRYLSKADFERYHFSGGCVFGGWIGFSQWIKHEFGAYPKREVLVELGRMGKGEREENTWFGVYSWEKKRSKERNYTGSIGLRF